MTEATIAVLQTEVRHLTASLTALEKQAEERRKAQEQDTRSILEELARLRADLEGGRGFARGVRFTVGAIWAVIGAGVATIVQRIFFQ